MRFFHLGSLWGGAHAATELLPCTTPRTESDVDHGGKAKPAVYGRCMFGFEQHGLTCSGGTVAKRSQDPWTIEIKAAGQHVVYGSAGKHPFYEIACSDRFAASQKPAVCSSTPRFGGSDGTWLLVGSDAQWETRSVHDQLDTAAALVTPMVAKAFRKREEVLDFVKTAVAHGFPNRNQHMLLGYSYAKAQDDETFNYLDFTLYSKDVLGRPLAANTIYGCIEELIQRGLLEAALPTNDQTLGAGRPSKVFRITGRGKAAFEASALLSHQLADTPKGGKAA